MDRRLTPDALRHIAGRCSTQLHVHALVQEIRACWRDLAAARHERDSAIESVREWVALLQETPDSLHQDADIRALAAWLETLLDHDLDEDFPPVDSRQGRGGASLTGPLAGAEVHRG